MIEINKSLLDQITEKAKGSVRQRMNFNFHQKPDDTMHRMLNALEPETYIRPHKHENPDKNEAFILLRGKVLIVEFDKEGSIVQYTILSHEKGIYGVEIPPRTFHTLISLEADTIIYEVKDGPYDVKNDKLFALWAPEEGSSEGKKFIRGIVERIRL